MAFHFPLMPRIFMALRQADRHPITEILRQTPEIPDTCQWALFLRNHDELTLEMVTDEERDYMYRGYPVDARMRLNLGIRRRLAPMMEDDLNRVRLLKSLLLSLPGTPVLYYGDEIGMGENIFLGDRNGVRTPMQWSGDRNAGFSRADPQRLYLPVIMDPLYGYQTVNVENQERNSASLLWWMKRSIALRKQHKVFGHGRSWCSLVGGTACLPQGSDAVWKLTCYQSICHTSAGLAGRHGPSSACACWTMACCKWRHRRSTWWSSRSPIRKVEQRPIRSSWASVRMRPPRQCSRLTQPVCLPASEVGRERGCCTMRWAQRPQPPSCSPRSTNNTISRALLESFAPLSPVLIPTCAVQPRSPSLYAGYRGSRAIVP